MEYSKTFNCETKMIILGVTERRRGKFLPQSSQAAPMWEMKSSKTHSCVYDS